MPIQTKQQPPYYTGSNQIKIYTILLTQTSTNPPTAIILENTLGEIPTFQYAAPGSYNIISANALFKENKTTILSGPNGTDYLEIYRASDSSISINTTGNDSFTNVTLQITIYP